MKKVVKGEKHLQEDPFEAAIISAALQFPNRVLRSVLYYFFRKRKHF